jgi:20S proteasome subunit beta 6
LTKLTDKVVVASCGNLCDSETLISILRTRVKTYHDIHEGKEMSLNAIAQLMSTLMYQRRLFPYMTSSIVAGIDEGEGFVYSFDPVGHIQKKKFNSGGSAEFLIQPILDNVLGLKNMKNVMVTSITQDFAIRLVRDVFVTAAERDIHTGDGIEIAIINKNEVKKLRVPLRKD